MGNEKKASQDDELQNIVSELKTLKECVSKNVKSNDLKTAITSTIKEILTEHKTELEELLEEKIKSYLK